VFARWQSERADARVVACFVVAAAVHVAALGGALVASRVPAKVGDALSFIDAIVEPPAFADAVEVQRPAPLAAPAPPPPPEVLPPAPPSAHGASAGDPYEQAAAVAAASKLLTGQDASIYGAATRDDDTGPGYGLVAGDGTADTATFDRGARISGVLGGTGSAVGPKGRGGDGSDDLGPDRSRRSGVIGGYTDECEFPDNARGIDSAVAVVVVAVRPNGTAASVVVASDPGHGFGPAAKACALRSKYVPALDRRGHKIASISPPITVRFTR
jgi:protein TonB